MTKWCYFFQAIELPSSRERAGAGPGGQPRPGVHRRRGLLQDGHLVLDDGAGEQAVVPYIPSTKWTIDGWAFG